MNIKLFSTLSIFALILTGCNTMKTSAGKIGNYHFELVKTYQWIDGPEKILEEADTYINKDIQTALNNELIEKGLKETPNNADIQIAYYLKLHEEKQTVNINETETQFAGGFVYDKNDQQWNYSKNQPDLNIYTVEMGTLVVLVYDTKTGALVWRGKLKTQIDRARPHAERQKVILEAAKKLMDKFPLK